MTVLKSTKNRVYELPDEFWFGYLQVHNYLMLNEEFTSKVFGPNKDTFLSDAFAIVEHYFDRFWLSWIHFELDA